MALTISETKAFLKEAFAKVIENVDADEAMIAQYFSKDYQQYVDGKHLDYQGFVAHMQAQKSVVAAVKVSFKSLVVEGDKIATVHIVHAVKKDGSEIEAQVNALFQIHDKKIILCDELTYLLKGKPEDRDLGSRH